MGLMKSVASVNKMSLHAIASRKTRALSLKDASARTTLLMGFSTVRIKEYLGKILVKFTYTNLTIYRSVMALVILNAIIPRVSMRMF